jgi:hypothetical protein
MKTLDFHRDEKKDRVTVTCADGEVSVHSHCAYCRHCKSIIVGKRATPAPQGQTGDPGRSGNFDETLMNAAMMFNTLVRDGSALVCDDDAGTGFQRRF